MKDLSETEGFPPLFNASISSSIDINDMDSENRQAGGRDETTLLSEYSIDFTCEACLLGVSNVAFTTLSRNNPYAFFAAAMADDSMVLSLASTDSSWASIFANISHTSPLSGFKSTLFRASSSSLHGFLRSVVSTGHWLGEIDNAFSFAFFINSYGNSAVLSKRNDSLMERSISHGAISRSLSFSLLEYVLARLKAALASLARSKPPKPTWPFKTSSNCVRPLT
mmetsp:Transcript_12801/g.27611  ORF Transcript_12801/g.27611 Transcript_12801/m.27611 type:complete len:224 (-) Transcript_12801:2578-3249(-)